MASENQSMSMMTLLDNSVPDRAMVTYIEELTKFKFANSSRLSDGDNEKINQSLAKLKDALKVSVLVTVTLQSKGSDQKIAKKALESNLSSKLKALSIGEELMIPSGFMRGSIGDILAAFKHDKEGLPKMCGHAVFVKCTKTAETTYQFEVQNTGFGNERHYRKGGKVKALRVRGDLKTDKEINAFFEKLVNCATLPIGAEKPDEKFYSCFKGENFTSVKDLPFDESLPLATIQATNSCTQFSVRAFLKGELGESLFGNFDEFMIVDGIKKCREFLTTPVADEVEKDLRYKHPMLKPKNLLHLLLVKIITLIFYKTKVHNESGHLSFDVSRDRLNDFVEIIEKTVKAQRSTKKEQKAIEVRFEQSIRGLALRQNLHMPL